MSYLQREKETIDPLRPNARQLEVVKYYMTSGESCREVAKRFGTSHETVGRWTKIFAPLIECSDVVVSPPKKRGRPRKSVQEAKKSSSDVENLENLNNFAPETDIIMGKKSSTESEMPQSVEELQARLKKMEAALRWAELRADAYDEMINVAEAKFNIKIRKKAGAKQ